MSEPIQPKKIIVGAILVVLCVAVVVRWSGADDVDEEALVKATTSTDVKVAAEAITKLSYTNGDAHVEIFRSRLKDERPPVRQAAVTALGRTKKAREASMPDVVNTLKRDESPQVRAAAARALGRQMHPRDGGIEAIFTAMNDKKRTVRIAGYDAIRDILRADIPFDVNASEGERLEVIKEYRKLWAFTERKYRYEDFRDRFEQSRENEKKAQSR